MYNQLSNDISRVEDKKFVDGREGMLRSGLGYSEAERKFRERFPNENLQGVQDAYSPFDALVGGVTGLMTAPVKSFGRFLGETAADPLYEAGINALSQTDLGGLAAFLKPEAAKRMGLNLARREEIPVRMHGSMQGKIDEFYKPEEDFGTHFGDMNQAFDRITSNQDNLFSRARMHAGIVPQDLNLIKMEDSQNWKPLHNLRDLYDSGYLDYDAFNNLSKRMKSIDNPDTQQGILRKHMEEMGYDGFKYLNTYEGEGMRESIALFDPQKQFTPVGIEDIGLDVFDQVPLRIQGGEDITMEELLKQYFHDMRKE